MYLKIKLVKNYHKEGVFMIKRIIAGIVSASILLQSQAAFADDFASMDNEQSAQAAGVYIEEILKYINENYMGDAEISTEELMHVAIKAIAENLDEYSAYLTPEEYQEIKAAEDQIWYAPDFECSFDEDGYPTISKINQTSRAYQMGIRVGNSIRSIDGVSTYGIGEEEYSTRVTRTSAAPIKMGIASKNIVNEINVPITTVQNSTVLSYDISDIAKGSESVKFDDKSVGYIKITSFSSKTSDEFLSAMNKHINAGCDKLILDLRDNTGGYVDEAIKIAQMIVPQGLIISSKDKAGNITSYTSTLKQTPFKKYVVLVNSVTASASEILASAMQESGIATVVGEQTYGKGVMQSVMDFGDAGVIKMTTQEYTTRQGNSINKVGITPDVNVDKLLFVSEEDDINDNKVAVAMRFLGFRVDENNSIEKAIGSYQAEMKIPITYKLDKETINAINLEIYDDMLNNDRILTTGYMTILS